MFHEIIDFLGYKKRWSFPQNLGKTEAIANRLSEEAKKSYCDVFCDILSADHVWPYPWRTGTPNWRPTKKMDYRYYKCQKGLVLYFL